MVNRSRIQTVILVTVVAAACGKAPAPAPPAIPGADLQEATITELQQKMASGQETSRSLVDKYLARIKAFDAAGPALHSVIEVNPDAETIANQLDAERRTKGPRGPLHGIPVS